MINLDLKKAEAPFKDTEKELLSIFYSGCTGKTNKRFRFARVDSNFMNYLPHLKDGAVKLYLYYAAAAKNDNGESWHSIDTISRNLGATERSIGNWNRQLESLGLIYRTSSGKKSRATFVLPLTSFAIRMSCNRIAQILSELNLHTSNEYSKVFGKVQSAMKIYVKSEPDDAMSEIICIHLKRTNTVGTVEFDSVDTFIYDVSAVTNEGITQKLSEVSGEEKVVIINGEKESTISGYAIPLSRSFFINSSIKIDDSAVFDIMQQLTDDVDFSDLVQISI